LDSSNLSSVDLLPTENGLVGKENRRASPVMNLVLDGKGIKYVVPAVLSYVSSNSEKNDGELWISNAYLYATIIPAMYCATMSYAL